MLTKKLNQAHTEVNGLLMYHDPKNPLTKPLPDWFFETIKKMIQEKDDDIHKTELC